MIKDFEKLKTLVEKDTGNENECRTALRPLSKYLMGDSNLILTKAEWTSDRGRIDLILIAEPVNTQLNAKLFATDKIAKIYELKSPSKIVFEFHKGSKRFFPSKDLIAAETQLLDYTYRSMQDSTFFQTRFGTSDIRPSGIIIGRDKTMFKISETEKKLFKDEDDLDYLKMISIKTRLNLLYRNNGIELFNWDHVLTLISGKI